MRIYNATKGTMNLPMANGSRLIIGSMEVSKQFYPTVELLNLLVSAYSRDDIAIIIDSSAEISMGATVSALPGYVVEGPEEAIMRFKKNNKSNNETHVSQDTTNKSKESVVTDNKVKAEGLKQSKTESK
jgi:hypothetical protein